MAFVHLHIHNNLGSNLDGVANPIDYAKRAFEKNHKALAVTDHGRLSAIFEHQKACIKYGVKPIIGVEAYICDELETLDENGKRKRVSNYHLVILAKNEVGYKNLLKLNFISNKDASHFYYMPRITLKELFEHKEGLIVGSACMANPFVKRVRIGKADEAEKLFEKFVQEFGEDFYAEVQLNEITNSMDYLTSGQKTANEWMMQMANIYGVPIVMTGDVHYLEPGQDIIQTISIAIRNKTTMDNLNFELESKNLYYHDEEDFIKFNEQWNYGYKKSDIISWCNNSTFIADRCNFVIPERTKTFLPKIHEDSDAFLIERSKKGLIEKMKVNSWAEIPEEYRKRLLTELEVLIRKGFSDYINILEDVYNFVKEERYYRGPARGSCAGSLVMYALDISTIDPIKYNLIFERFISESRTPDIVLNYFTKN
jgi:DNA polymerase III subunit alpha